MTEEPTVDGRSQADLLADLRETAENYTETWDPHSSDSGTTLLQVFSRFQHDVTRRLDSVPEKHRIAFLDALDFDRRPPQAARIPLSFETTDDIDSNVVVPGGTQATADTDDGETVLFEIPGDEGFEATPADLAAVYGVDPANDRIFDHGARLDSDESATLFAGSNVQEHAFYLGHSDLLNLEAESTVTVRLLTNAAEQVLEDSLVWEYYGEAEETVGWHRLPQRTTDAIDVYSDAGIEDLREAVKERIQEYDAGDAADWGTTPFELTFELPGPTEDLDIAGTESRWIRARAVDPDPSYVDIEVESVSLNVERDAEDGGISPEEALQNDVPLPIDDDEAVFPFGRRPQAPTTLYLASEEAFTKRGAVIDVRFEPPEEPREPLSTADDGDGSGSEADGGSSADGDGDGSGGDGTADGDDEDWTPETMGALGAEEPPEISWEYWDGGGWSRLRLRADETHDLREPGTVRFTVPSDLAETSVSGHDGYWIRARFVSGSYGQYRYEINSDGTRGDPIERPEPPRFGTVRLRYNQKGEGFEEVLTDNNASLREVETDGPQLSFVPFAEPPEDTQTVYLGFDARLHDGPVTLHLLTEDRTYPRTFEPRIRWEYCVAPERMAWERLDVHDGTEGLTEQGVVSLTFPEGTTAFELFGERRHWIRFRVTGDEYHAAAGQQKVAGNQPVADLSAGGPAGLPTTPPTVEAVYPNTQWAYNVETVANEVVGSSDGSHDQTVTCEAAPLMDIEVWVDELGALSATERETLAADRPDDVDPVRTNGTEPEAFWVRWTEVDDFLESGPSDRHYRVDRTAGLVRFGDGQRGAIPPSGEDNVRATYETGGGQVGNVGAGTVTDLEDSVSQIDDVTNHRPSDGGADVESMETVLSRAPKRIKNRGRAVSPEDFEAVAKAASRELATVTCEPEMDANGDRRPGWVTLLVVPRERRARPAPTMELRGRVADAVAERAPATLAGGDRERITVRGPSYAAISVETTVRAEAVESISTLKETIEATLTDYLHPLTGHNGEGWAFGEAPRLSGIRSLLDDVEGVSEVSDVLMSVSTQGEEVKIRDETVVPDLDRDAMVCSGSHEVAVTRADPRDGDGR